MLRQIVKNNPFPKGPFFKSKKINNSFSASKAYDLWFQV